MTVLLIYTALVTPVRISFPDKGNTMKILDYITDVLFMTDIFINFLTAYEDEQGTIIYAKKAIARYYIKSWFFIDIISSLPL
jgi:hypothetical protein